RGRVQADAGREPAPHGGAGAPPHRARRQPERGRYVLLEVRQLRACVSPVRHGRPRHRAAVEPHRVPDALAVGQGERLGQRPDRRRPRRALQARARRRHGPRRPLAAPRPARRVPANRARVSHGGPSMTTTLSLDDLKTHIGRTQVTTDVLHAGPANLLRLALGRPEPELRDGDPLPPAWLALYFLPRLATDALRPDGAPGDAGVVPPMPLPRRMFAGERQRFHRALRLGEAVRRETTLADISLKSGTTGTLVFATIVSRVFGRDGALAVEDERRTVFREEIKAGERNQAPRRDPAPTDVRW